MLRTTDPVDLTSPTVRPRTAPVAPVSSRPPKPATVLPAYASLGHQLVDRDLDAGGLDPVFPNKPSELTTLQKLVCLTAATLESAKQQTELAQNQQQILSHQSRLIEHQNKLLVALQQRLDETDITVCYIGRCLASLLDRQEKAQRPDDPSSGMLIVKLQEFGQITPEALAGLSFRARKLLSKAKITYYHEITQERMQGYRQAGKVTIAELLAFRHKAGK